MSRALSIAPGVSIPYRALTRHIAIFGATGTGKTTTAAAIVERCPCPVIVLDAKGDLESMGRPLLYPWQAQMRVDDMGPDLMARAFDLSPAQAGVLQIVMAYAADYGIPVASLADLRNLLADALGLADELTARYGLMSASSLAAVQRAILKLSRAAPWAFGSTNVDWRDVTGTTVYAASHITAHHGLYGAFVASMLESLYSGLGEIGDSGAPALMVMIDEAHLVFDGASPAITRRIEQITRLIRSKGVGLIYVTQAPADLPDAIAGQMATRIQHGLRAATASQGKAARAAADTMPGNATLQDVLTLGIGQALVSVPDARGIPLPTRKVNVARGKINLEPLPYATPPGPEAANRPFHDPREPINFKPDRQRRWYYWPLVIAAWIYGPLILLEILF